MKNQYLDWLIQKVRGKQSKVLLEYLYKKEFHSVLPNDDNRAVDGILLRQRYEEETNNFADPENIPCSILEMLIALSDRIDYILYDPAKRSEDAVWFWNLINNLDLSEDLERNDRILKNLVERRYFPNGKGGLFPLKKPKSDQTKVEIWYQMTEYLDEK